MRVRLRSGLGWRLLPYTLTGSLVFHASRRAAAFLAAAAALTVTLTACGSASGPESSATGSPTAAGAASQVTVKGGFGTTPTVTIPDGPPPAALTHQTLVQGNGPTVATGDLLVANYVGQVWASKKVFDSSFSRGEPIGKPIGVGQLITGWDKTLVGQKVGSRVLLTIPPADGYGAQGQPQAGISGTDTLVFVVDLVGAYKPTASAPGKAAGSLPAGWPKITGAPGTKPAIASVKGVKAPTKPASKLIVKGTGDKIDPSKTLVLQLVGTDLATGKKSEATWGQDGQGPEAAPASNVLQLASALSGQHVGARAVVLVPATKGTPASGSTPAQQPSPAEVLVVDVVGQF